MSNAITAAKIPNLMSVGRNERLIRVVRSARCCVAARQLSVSPNMICLMRSALSTMPG